MRVTWATLTPTAAMSLLRVWIRLGSSGNTHQSSAWRSIGRQLIQIANCSYFEITKYVRGTVIALPVRGGYLEVGKGISEWVYALKRRRFVVGRVIETGLTRVEPSRGQSPRLPRGVRGAAAGPSYSLCFQISCGTLSLLGLGNPAHRLPSFELHAVAGLTHRARQRGPASALPLYLLLSDVKSCVYWRCFPWRAR